MGSLYEKSDDYVLPEATAPSLVLAHPTDDEKRQTWTLNHKEWGGGLSLQEYLDRENFLTTIPLSGHGGMSYWVLTDSSWVPANEKETRPVLASCESIRKRVLVASPGDTEARSGIGHGVGSVFTYPKHRGYRYAGRMLNELGPVLRSWQSKEPDNRDVVCSALWSDIGKTYYAKKGWAAFPSSHVEFPIPPADQMRGGGEADEKITPITYDNLEQLCKDDEKLVCAQVVRTARKTGRTTIAFAPDHDTLRWHLYRDEFIASRLLKKSPAPTPDGKLIPTIKGAIAGTKNGRRVWALWSRNYSGASGAPADTVDKNTLYILRLVIEPEATGSDSDDAEKISHEDDILAAFTAVMHTAQREAAAWHLGKIDLWNPSPAVAKLIESCGLTHRWVHRDVDSIPSMMWYGGGGGGGDKEKKEDGQDIEWVANEKYCWC
ncbi:uncharacterized protein GGS25DRAFT_62452 [Hypoxylon fragiforme]|uniref:uncharacterized protein n=1 Tax=Hypoxylon fragiforme TaxID=63214 RepID=UPI0020C66D5A|nr:uncharacterized protein GGS25DRAFT_62452 [Hypoxylon fragiforme]KAI2614699.1 hypothetical protein GGS25DRAFT_62452 [Hypoxylon fragiforme]